ncbi:putative defense protein 3 isoform X1 [Rhipicephalus microplus]|uniref:putative defense protein 3 isoform X1 n=1 Tax=Rhipicephalus microplus TaxID=6941 RepID=UPI0018876537|nr:putative defense protein 1 [Rhipicephalus microplus]XP_037279602.1 putative defense protein 1 [Rhipicephalus microplus]
MNRASILRTVVVLLLVSLVERSLALPDGAPEGTCDDMMPFHVGSKHLNGSDSPYMLVQEKETFEPNESISVQLHVKSSYFRGFLVKAFSEQGEDVGHFLEGPNYKPMETCSGATHESNNDKKNVKFVWKAPVDKSGSVRFKATVVHDYSLFYTDLWSTVKRRHHLSDQSPGLLNKHQ